MHVLNTTATPRVDAAEELHGVRFDDPFRWLESESPEVQAWERERHDAAGAVLRAIPGYERLEAAVADHMQRGLVLTPKRGGDRWFALERHPEHGVALTVAPAPGRPGRVLTFAGALIDGPNAGIDWFHPAPDGRHVAVGVSVRGDEQSVLHVLDADDGGARLRPVPFVSGGRVAWLPDSSGLYFGAGLARDTENAVKHVFSWTVGDAAPTGPLPLRSTERSLAPQVSACGRYVGITGSFICPRLMHVLDRRTGEWTDAFAGDRDLRFSGVFVDDRYVAVTTEGAPRGRLVSAPADRPDDRSAWVELVPEQDDATLRTVSRCGDRLVLADYVHGVTRLRIATLDGVVVDEVPLPGAGVAAPWGLFTFQVGGDAPVEVGRDEITFVYSEVRAAPRAYRYDLAARRLEALTPAAGDPLPVRVRRAVATAPDGRAVPYVLVARTDVETDRPRPTVVYAYGGWNITFLAEIYLGIMAPVVAAGGVVVFPHLRGDATFGHDQWLDGKLANKQKSFDDLYAVAEDLIAAGVTTSDRLGLFGSSNGGLLGGTVAHQRPELFSAIVSAVPLLDMCRFQNERFSEMFAEEYGDPRDPEHARVLREYSPVHNIPEQGAFPAMLLVAGASDVRCQPWHARKLAALLEAAQTADRPVLLRVHPDQGHACTVAGPPAIAAEWIGFLMHQIGLPLEAAHFDQKGPLHVG